MVELKDILYKTTINAVVGNTGIKVNAINFDSRKVEKYDVRITSYNVCYTKLLRESGLGTIRQSGTSSGNVTFVS